MVNECLDLQQGELHSGCVLSFIVASEGANARSGSRYLYNTEVGVDVFLSDWVANTEMCKHRICGNLHACSRSVKFAGRFRSKPGSYDPVADRGQGAVTCALTITGLGCHAGSGEDGVDEENAMTAADSSSA